MLVLVEDLRRACSCATFSQLSLGCWRIFLLRVTEVSRHAGLAWAKEAVHATRHSLSQQRVDESVGQEWLTTLCADWLEITRNGRFSLVFQEFHWASSFLRDESRNFLVNMNNKSRESCHPPPIFFGHVHLPLHLSRAPNHLPLFRDRKALSLASIQLYRVSRKKE